MDDQSHPSATNGVWHKHQLRTADKPSPSLVIFLIVLFASPLYGHGTEYRALPSPSPGDVSAALSGLNLAGYASGGCPNAYPSSTSRACFPVDPQSLARGLAAGDLNNTSISYGTPLSQLRDLLISVDILLAMIGLSFALYLVGAVRKRLYESFLLHPLLRGHADKILFNNAKPEQTMNLVPREIRSPMPRAASGARRVNLHVRREHQKAKSVTGQLGGVDNQPYSDPEYQRN